MPDLLPVANLRWDEYRGYAPGANKRIPFETKWGPVPINPHRAPPPGTLELLRRLLCDPCLCIWKLDDVPGDSGWFVGRVERIAKDEGGYKDHPLVREILCVEYPNEAAVGMIRERSELFIGTRKVLAAPMNERAAWEKGCDAATDENTDEAVEEEWGAMRRAVDDMPARNDTRENRLARRREVERVLAVANGNVSLLPSGLLGVRGIARGKPRPLREADLAPEA